MSDSDESDNRLSLLEEPYTGTCSGCDKREWLIYDHMGNHYCGRICFENNCGING